MKLSPKLVVGGVVFAVAVGCINSQRDASSDAASSGTVASAAAAAPPQRPTGNLPDDYHATYGVYFDTADGRHEQGCASDDVVYDGDQTCQVGGETVVVKRAIDGDTVELTDGRKVRILGVDAPEAGACGADQAAAFTQSALVGNRLVVLHRQPGVTQNQYGHELGYLQYVDMESDARNKNWAPPASGDLGHALAVEGLVDIYESGGANATYMEAVRVVVDISKQLHSGIYGPPCSDPVPTVEPAPPSDSDIHVDVDNDDDHNSRDGSIIPACRHKWWC